MPSTRIQCALALLAVALSVCSVSGAPSDAKLRQFLQRSILAPSVKQVRERGGMIHFKKKEICTCFIGKKEISRAVQAAEI